MELWEIAFDKFQNKYTDAIYKQRDEALLQDGHGPIGMQKFKEVYQSLYSLGDIVPCSHSELADAVSTLLSHENAWEIFSMLPTKSQLKVIEQLYEYGEEIPVAVMISSLLAGSPDFSFLDAVLYGVDNFTAGLNSIEDEIFHNIQSPLFIRNCYYFLAPMIDPTASTTVFLLRRAYGEETINEILHRSLTEPTRLSMTDLVRIAYSWESIKHFPLDWCVTVATDLKDIVESLKAERRIS